MKYIAVMLLALFAMGCALPPEEAALIKNLEQYSAGDFVKDDVLKALAPYMEESQLTWTKYHFRSFNGKEFWITIDNKSMVLNIYRKNL